MWNMEIAQYSVGDNVEVSKVRMEEYNRLKYLNSTRETLLKIRTFYIM